MATGSRLYQYLATISALLTIVTSGMHYAWPSPSLPILLSNSSSLQISSDEGSWIAIVQLMSAMVSCFFAAVLVDIIGRKRSIVATAFPFFISWLMIAFANSSIYLYVARILAGVADGIAFTVIPLYLGEIADPQIRGLLGSSVSSMWIFGMLLINILGSYLSISLTAAVSSIFPLFLLITFIWMPESPYYLLMKCQFDSAREALEKFKGCKDVDVEFERLKAAVEEQNKNSGKFTDLFTKKGNRRALLVIAILRNAQQMSGAAAITFYTQTIFRESGDFLSPIIATMIYVSIQCVMAASCALVVDKTGRRPLLICSLTGSGFALCIEGVYFFIKSQTNIDTTPFNFIPVAALIGYVIIFNFGVQPIPLLMQGEFFPTNVKAMAACLSEVYFCIVASAFSKFFQIMNDTVGMYLPFLVFSGCCFVNLVFIVIILPETKGKTLEEVQAGFSATKKGKKIECK